MWFDDSIDRVCLTDLVNGERPPRPHLLCKSLPCNLSRRFDPDCFADAVRISPIQVDLLSHSQVLRVFVAARSAASLKASKVSSQKLSNHRRTASMPRLST